MLKFKNEFNEGSAYKVKLSTSKRRKTLTYRGTSSIEGVHVYKFTEKNGSVLFLIDEHFDEFPEIIESTDKVVKFKECTRCYGMGRFNHLKHVENGVCFKCGGSGKVEVG